MNNDSQYLPANPKVTAWDGPKNSRPILIVPYMWIGDFVRCHSVVKVLRERFPDRPVDLLATSLCAPLADYMPGVRQAIVADLPRSRLALSQQNVLAQRLKREGYGMALTMPRTWKAALAPYLAGIPERVGFAGEVRFFLLNDIRFGEKRLPRMIDRCAMLALPRGAKQPSDWPLPELSVPAAQIAAWRLRRGVTEDRPIVALANASVAVSNDSGLLHVAAAVGTPSIGIFGPTSPWHWAPLNPLAAVVETTNALDCRPCHKPVCRLAHHRCMRDIAPDRVLVAARAALTEKGADPRDRPRPCS